MKQSKLCSYLALVLAAAGMNSLGTCHHAVAQQPSFPLYCQGPLQTVGFITHFRWSSTGAGAQNPGPGQCAWADRGPRGSEIQAGDTNVIFGGLGQVANLPSGQFSEIGVFRDPNQNNWLRVTRVVGFVTPPFSAIPVLPPPPAPFNCASCNDGSCQCGPQTGAQLCSSHGGVNPTVGCQQQ